jgi:hypothetical protein
MEISPVNAVRIAPMVRPQQSDLGLTDVYEVERATRTGDETYIPGSAKAASGFEDDDDKWDDLEDDLNAELKLQPPESLRINRFA